MKPTLAQRFHARHWPARLWFTAVITVVMTVSLRLCEPSVAGLRDWRTILWLAAVACLSFLLGVLVSLVSGAFVLGVVAHDRILRNGGPFAPGDIVRILAPPYEGRLVRVCSRWQDGSVRVDLGRDAEEAFGDVFAEYQLLRVRPPRS